MFDGAPFDTIYLVACETLDSTGGCNFPGNFMPPVGFAIDNVSVAVIPEPAPAALTALGFGALWLAACRKR